MRVCKRCAVALVAVLGVWGVAAAEPVRPGGVADVRPEPGALARAIGVCYPVTNMLDAHYPAGSSLSPIDVAQEYFYLFERQTLVSTPAKVTVRQAPKHGAVENHGSGFFSFYPEKGYSGKDKATLIVDFGGLRVEVIYFFQVVEGPLGSDGGEKLCSPTGVYWKISSTLDSNRNGTITSVAYQV